MALSKEIQDALNARLPKRGQPASLVRALKELAKSSGSVKEFVRQADLTIATVEKYATIEEIAGARKKKPASAKVKSKMPPSSSKSKKTVVRKPDSGKKAYKDLSTKEKMKVLKAKARSKGWPARKIQAATLSELEKYAKGTYKEPDAATKKVGVKKEAKSKDKTHYRYDPEASQRKPKPKSEFGRRLKAVTRKPGLAKDPKAAARLGKGIKYGKRAGLLGAVGTGIGLIGSRMGEAPQGPSFDEAAAQYRLDMVAQKGNNMRAEAASRMKGEDPELYQVLMNMLAGQPAVGPNLTDQEVRIGPSGGAASPADVDPALMDAFMQNLMG